MAAAKVSQPIPELAKNMAIPLVVGGLVGLAIVGLYKLYEALKWLSQALASLNPLLLIASTTLALLLGYLTIKILAETKSWGCGTELMIEAYHYRGGLLSWKDTLSKTLASAFTIGFGGSAGLEGPSLLLGGGLTSLLTQKLNLKPEDVKRLFLCGAAAGFSAIFKAPLTGILLALEIPYRRDLETGVFVPAALASVSAYFVSFALLGGEALFPTGLKLVIPSPLHLLHSTLLGILASILAVAFIASMEKGGLLFQRLSSKLPVLPLVFLGGILLGLIGLYYPQTLGLGYETIREMASGQLYEAAFLALLGILIFKLATTTLTIRFGGSGGLFIPSLYLGGLLGLLYAKAFNLQPASIYVMVAMAAMLAAANKTLMTSVAFVAETIGPSTVILTLVSASVSYFLSGNRSLYLNQLPTKPVEEEEALTELRHLLGSLRESKLREITAEEFMTVNPVSLSEEMSISEVLDFIKSYGFRVYPVVDREGRLVGVLRVEDIFLMPPNKWHLPLGSLLVRKPLIALRHHSLLKILERMLREGEDHVYVVDNPKDRRLLGVIAAIDLLRKATDLLREASLHGR